ncbi:MAG TPA: chemotaxis protein CheX [Candidatus Binatia bacterium]|nr:chemotaxis protein CheX [Candidatus Binatia bacterium]
MRETALEVFSTMVGVSLTDPGGGNDPPVISHITGMVGIAGPVSATFTLRCSRQAAAFIASQMMGVPAEEALPMSCDAVGEICNIVAGYFKAKIGLGEAGMLSVPTVMAGDNYQVRIRGNDELMEMPLLHGQEAIWIALHVRA